LDSDHRVGVVVGLAAEARIARRLRWRVAIGGGTAPGAEAAARRLIDGGCDALVSFGLAGGLDPALRPGALVVPSAVILPDGEHRATDPGLARLLGGASARAVAGAGAIVANREDKRRLHDRTAAAATDLESGAVARVAAEYDVPFAVLRAVCDPAERSLPPATAVALDAHGVIAIWRLLAAIVARPAQLPALLALAADAAAARRALIARVRQIAQARG
jgi:adenosylhomocysteine nucleosidase